ncbi:DUF4062 domain-containing protein [Exiguobacterium sp. s133]|uniref:DUF4062 domain-containing protein n=1 Tax=Exiguobacterium sp. s133 TaxID=2751213 RepID=UPI001BE8689C|nr:DUF4062 domain-containing protein [Exiguobacterium sp. s133]
MKKKLQVFISSTYTDLIEERQAAVQAVLSAGHIPAGMELFKSGDESQKETIKKWIDESDVYLLILGGRYGTIEPVSGNSYTHWEYEYAGEIGKPRFSVVINEEALKEKVKVWEYPDVYEVDNRNKYEEFRSQVLNKTSEFFDDVKDIKITVIRKLLEYANMDDLKGWVSRSKVPDNESLIISFESLLKENNQLKNVNEKLQNELSELRKKITSEVNFVGGEQAGNLRLRDRTDRIFKVLNLEELYDENEGFKIMNDSNEVGQIYLPDPSEYFEVYKKYHDKYDDIVSEFIMVGMVEGNEKVEEYLSEIRVIISEQQNYIKDVVGVNVKFIIVVNDLDDKAKKITQVFLEKVMVLLELKKGNNYSIEIWDDKKIEEIEYELILKI